jgi:hypothetical protein
MQAYHLIILLSAFEEEPLSIPVLSPAIPNQNFMVFLDFLT